MHFIFDRDGVLTDFYFSELIDFFAKHLPEGYTLNQIQNEVQELGARIGFPSSRSAELQFWKAYVGQLEEQQCLSPRDIEQLQAFDYTRYMFPLPYTRETLQRIKEKGHVVSVLSNNPMTYINYSLKKMGLIDCIDHTFAAFQLRYQKPDPRCFLEVLEELDADPAQSVYLDNEAACVDGARLAGIRHCYLVTRDTLQEDMHSVSSIKDILNLL